MPFQLQKGVPRPPRSESFHFAEFLTGIQKPEVGVALSSPLRIIIESPGLSSENGSGKEANGLIYGAIAMHYGADEQLGPGPHLKDLLGSILSEASSIPPKIPGPMAAKLKVSPPAGDFLFRAQDISKE